MASKRRKQSKAAATMPQQLPGATEFSDDEELSDGLWLIRALKRFPHLTRDLFAETDLAKHYGRRRIQGRWALVMLHMVLAREVDIETYYHQHQSSPIWKVAGFRQVPSYQTAYLRLTELEPHADAFTRAANKLILRAVKHEPRIGQHVWVDATGFETHAVLEHCCTDKAKCERAGGTSAKSPPRATDEMVKDRRHAETDGPPNAGKLAPDGLKALPRASAPRKKPPRRRRPYRYFEYGKGPDKHLYRTLDPTAGARVYDTGGKKRFWLGGLGQAAVCQFLGAPLAVHDFAANEQEYHHYPELYAQLIDATRKHPEAVSGDRGLSIAEVFRHNTERGVGSVFPFRKANGNDARMLWDTDKFDRHGVPRCQYCGGPGDFESAGLGFYRAGAKPRIRFRCELRLTADCAKTQSIACSEQWRLLVPISRRTERYHALAKASKNLERVFRHWRERYNVAGNNVDTRPKRAGIEWQNLRAQVALLAEWFRINLRHGWLGSHKRLNTARAKVLKAKRRLRSTLSARTRHKLDLPWGRAAQRLGLAPAHSPP